MFEQISKSEKNPNVWFLNENNIKNREARLGCFTVYIYNTNSPQGILSPVKIDFNSFIKELLSAQHAIIPL